MSFCATLIGLRCQNEHHYCVLAFQDCNCTGLLHIDMSFCATVIGLRCQNEHHYGVLAFQDCNCRRLLHIYTSFCATLIRFSNARLQKQRASDGLGYWIVRSLLQLLNFRLPIGPAGNVGIPGWDVIRCNSETGPSSEPSVSHAKVEFLVRAWGGIL